MIKKIMFYLLRTHTRQYLSLALSRGAATSASRIIDPTDPITWEFSAFSQNGEDGIIDFLVRKIKNPNNYFVEIGSSNGLENNSTWLGVARKYSGIMIEGNRKAAKRCEQYIANLNPGIEVKSLFVDKDNAKKIKSMAYYDDPDLFSLDIDGIDFYVAETLMDSGLRPKIIVVEYNSTFGPSKTITVPYQKKFNYLEAHTSHLYFGVSISGWKKFLDRYGFEFVTVDSRGTNGFFINPEYFEPNFIRQIKGQAFKENFYQLSKFKQNWEERFKLIQKMEFITIA